LRSAHAARFIHPFLQHTTDNYRPLAKQQLTAPQTSGGLAVAANYGVDLHKHWWARTVSNRRPLVCKSEPEGPPRFTRFHSVFKCAGQRVVSIHPVHGLSGCFGSS
jgi:hypothetical protein